MMAARHCSCTKEKTRTKQQFAANETSDVTRDAQGLCNPPRDSYDRPQIDVIIMGDSFALCVPPMPKRPG